MRTSASQFQLLVDFMERNGDLSKPTEGPQGRATNFRRWEQLTEILNADATGDTKTAEKWRKVWSDYKNNIKKKAARIHRAAQRTGGGPASNLRLGDLEQKVLGIIGAQAATGIDTIPEIGLEEEVTEPPPDTEQFPNSLSLQDERDSSATVADWNRPGTSAHPTPLPATNMSPTELINSLAAIFSLSAVPEIPVLGQPVEDRTETGLTVGAARTPRPSTRAARSAAPQSPTPLPLTPRRRRRGRLQDPSSPIYTRTRTRTQTQSDLARQAFVRSDSEWRAFQQETERERNRLRQDELRMQERWLNLFSQFISLGNRIVDVIEKKL